VHTAAPHVAVEDVLITSELIRRTAAPRDMAAENEAFIELARLMVQKPDALLHRLVELAMELTAAGTAGVSLVEGNRLDGKLRWIAIAGAYAAHIDGTIPADFSPCGDCLRRGTVELFSRPARAFPYLASISPPVIECLVVPLRSPTRPLGTLWVMSHDEQPQFTSADAACLTALGSFTAASLELLMARDAAQQASRTKDEFLAMVSHELRGPLASILGWAEMLLSGRLDPAKAVHALEAIHAHARHQSERVEDLLDTSRIVTGHFTLKRAPCDVRTIVDRVAGAAAPMASKKRVSLAFQAGAEPLLADVDEDRVVQALDNVVGNAVKFTPGGGTITIDAINDGKNISVVVSDTGDGIPDGLLPFVFDPFWQADRTTTRRHAGLGLGLSIARHIVELHGGRISAQSGGKAPGTTITITLPRLATLA
jgi:signal transduction histidine kinase